MIDEAMTIREQVGRVSEVTWSKVQSTSMTIGRTQGYALRQLDALTDKVEREAKVGGLAKKANEAESLVQEWLAVLARCFQLQDATAVLDSTGCWMGRLKSWIGIAWRSGPRGRTAWA